MIGTAIGFLQLSQERVEVERGRLLTRWKGDIRFDLLGDDGLHRIDDVDVRYHPVPVGVRTLVSPLERVAAQMKSFGALSWMNGSSQHARAFAR